jgi:predicted nucleotidyltransferase component of viral defense system
MIHPAEISRMAHRLGLGDKTIEKDYVLTWVLLAIAASPLLHDLLAFKGGTAIKKMYVPDYRFSEDLDFTMLETKGTNNELSAAVEGLFPWLGREANLTLATQKMEEHSSGNPTIYLNYVGPLQASLASRSLKVDFSRDETLAFPTEERHVQSPYSDCQARQETLLVYSTEEILAEKLRSLLTRTEPRDLYDVHFLLTNRMADVEQLSFNAAPKFESKGLATGDLKTVLERRRATFKQLWSTRLSGQMPEIPDLDDVIRETNRVLQKYF